MNKQIEVLKMEERHIDSINKSIKECMMEVEGRDFPYKRVTVWQDHPEYAGIQAGAKFNHSYIDVKPQKAKPDGSHINPKSGKPYNNYTLVYGEYGGEKEMSGGLDMKKSMQILNERITRLEKEVFKSEPPKESTDYPTDEISPEDIPFN